MPFSPLSLHSPCLVSIGNSGFPSSCGGSGKQVWGREQGNLNFPKKPRGKLRVPRSPDALSGRNWCRVRGNSGFPRRSSQTELVRASAGKFGVPSTPFPNGIGASAGKFGVPSTPFPNGIGASAGKFGVPMSVHTESAPGLRDPPVYTSGRN